MTMPKLELPDSGVSVRMYRQGHGDCFLLAMPRDGGGDPVYVLIDCGYKPGSPAYLHNKPIEEIVEHIGESTGRHLDLMILTHEHQDHLNGIWKKTKPYFDEFQIDEAWVA
jgi:glyoxylase-like metal-dependent hydrolase (beta-lactamase superfamily II)